MTKQELVRAISRQTGIDQFTVLTTIESFMQVTKDAMIDGEELFLRGFGSFILKHRAEKTARNISKGETLVVPAHDLPAFKPCKEFQQAVVEASTK